MKNLIKSALFVFILTLGLGVNAQNKNVVEIAVGSEDHTTLVAAVKAAELAGVLSGDGPFTIFAPTNDAFDALPDGTVATLLKPENKATLQTILKYHVVSGNVMASDVMNLLKANNGKAKVKTLAGSEITVWSKDGSVYIQDAKGNSAKVVATDLKGTNGVIHVIDSVLLPQ